MILKVPLWQQHKPHTCLPACVRMILAFHGLEHTEEELTQVFKTIPFLGTQPVNVVSGLEGMGYHALWFENGTIERLLELLAINWPVIVFYERKICHTAEQVSMPLSLSALKTIKSLPMIPPKQNPFRWN